MKKYTVNAIDKETGAASPIDTIEVEDNYTTEDYISDCSDNWDADQMEMFEKCDIEFEGIND